MSESIRGSETGPLAGARRVDRLIWPAYLSPVVAGSGSSSRLEALSESWSLCFPSSIIWMNSFRLANIEVLCLHSTMIATSFASRPGEIAAPLLQRAEPQEAAQPARTLTGEFRRAHILGPAKMLC